ncbi:Zinc/iron permease [Kalaharituber pfeilii]|nr:Zinc/iron permease [Kalaharituber pfeilii]
MNMPTRDPEPTWNPTYNQNPPELDKDLTTRTSLVCGGGKLSEDEYNLGLHVMALFVVLAQSTLACAFPLIAKRFRFLRIPPVFLFYARHFGTGVLIATAFVHLLPTAFISLTDPCLPPIWNEDYPAMPGAIAMAAVFFVTIVEMVFARGHMCGKLVGEVGEEGEMEAGRGKGLKDVDSTDRDDISEQIGGAGGVGKVGFGMAGQRRSRSYSTSQGLRNLAELQRYRSDDSNRISHNNDVLTEVHAEENQDGSRDISITPDSFKNSSKPELTVESLKEKIQSEHTHGKSPLAFLTPAQKHKKALLQVALLEMGILFHSVFIGMALSVTIGSPFIVLLLAILFHQTFEGLALGSRIAVLNWAPGQKQPWFMALAYGMTTPIGQAIGLATHTLYSPESKAGLLMVGIMNSISSGLLVFAGLVELLAEDFLSDDSWKDLRGKKRLTAFLSVILGAVGMSVVGAWA